MENSKQCIAGKKSTIELNHNIHQYYFLHISVTVEAPFKYEMLF